ncbi:MAG: energy-coupling factor transporter transmembrane protein EcfT [Actinobacteria bacterium]|nr:energy-coupling factor transporter transmembrane protein EcfT [Actinomycetota bacterium]
MATHDRALVAALGAREVRLPAAEPAETSVDGAAPGQPASTTAARRPPVDRINPVAALAASLIPALLLVVSIDPVSAATALALQLLLLPLLGVPLRTLALRSIPILIAAPFTALTIVLYGRPSGEVHVEFLLVRISDGSIELALATLLRVLAIGLPAIALFSRPDATRLGDALGQTLRLPARFVLGAVAALRLVTLLRGDAATLERARRARGVGDRGRIRRFAGILLGLLVLSLRRGSALAIGLEARGFGAPVARTWTRPAPWTTLDTVVVVIGMLVSSIALLAAVLTGSFTGVLR